MKKSIILVALLLCLTALQAQEKKTASGSFEVTNATVDELHKQLNDRVQKYIGDEKREKLEIILQRGKMNRALDRNFPVVLEQIVIGLSNGNVTSIEMYYEEAAMRKMYTETRILKNPSASDSNLGRISLSYSATGALDEQLYVQDITLEKNRSKVVEAYKDGLIKTIQQIEMMMIKKKGAQNSLIHKATNLGKVD